MSYKRKINVLRGNFNYVYIIGKFLIFVVFSFNEKMQQFLETVVNINMEEEVNKEFADNLTTIQEHGCEVRKKQWTEYIAGFTKNLLQNVSRLSTL